MPLAIVTGASKGIGREIATSLARRGYDLLLVARSENLLHDLSLQLENEYKIRAFALSLDLTLPDAALQIKAWCEQQKQLPQVLVNNAGYGLFGSFESLSLPDQQNMLQLNVQAPVALTHHLLPLLHQAAKAYILNVTSTASYQAVPMLTLYAASKSFMVLFSRGLRYELRKSGISVSCVSPGATVTDFPERAGMNEKAKKAADKIGMSAAEVAEFAVSQMLRGKAEIIPGLLNFVSAKAVGWLPKSLVEKIAASIYE